MPGDSGFGARLRVERKARVGTVRALAEAIRDAAPEPERQRLPQLLHLTRLIRGWESGRHGISERYRLLVCRALHMTEEELFPATTSSRHAPTNAFTTFSSLVGHDVDGADGDGHQGGQTTFTVERVEGLLKRLYRLEAEFGGNELCLIVSDQADAATTIFNASTIRVDTGDRLLQALAGLTQIAGWLSIDANRHAAANRYLTSTIYAALEIDDLSLAGHALGYMSLHAFYRGRPKTALALAETACGLASAEGTPRTRAALHNRAARAHARLGEDDAARRRLDYARAAYGDERRRHDPEWIAYVGESELAAQCGACFLDLGRADEAISAMTEAIGLLETAEPAHARDLAHYKIRLASAYLLRGEPEQAVQVSREAHSITAQIGSARVDERFAELVGEIAQVDTPEARDLVEELSAR